MLLEISDKISGFINITKDTNTLLLPIGIDECISVFKIGVNHLLLKLHI